MHVMCGGDAAVGVTRVRQEALVPDGGGGWTNRQTPFAHRLRRCSDPRPPRVSNQFVGELVSLALKVFVSFVRGREAIPGEAQPAAVVCDRAGPAA